MYIWHIVLVCLIPMISFSGASVLLPYSDTEMMQSSNFNDGKSYPPENPKLETKDVKSRLDILENVIYKLMKENRDQHEGIQQLKILNENQYKEILQLKNEINHQTEGIRQIRTENDIQKEDIRQLKDANQNREEDIQQMKSVMDLLIVDCAIFNRTTNHYVKSYPRHNGVSIATSAGDIEKPNGIGGRMKRQSNADGVTSSGSWAMLEISDLAIGNMDYDGYGIKIYGYASNKDINMKNEEKKYYFEPIGQLDHRSAKSSFNNISKKAEMTFNVNMWSESIRNAVHKFIADDLKLGPVNIHLVRVLPMDRVMLFNEVVSSQHFEIEQNWINYKSDKYLKFKYTCDQLKKCEDLAVQMKNNPEQFYFNMRFSLSSQRSQTKTTKISIESIANGYMMNELQQKFPNKETILVTANGKKQLLKESSENVIIQITDDSQVPSKNSQSEIYRRLENMIQFSRTTIQKDDEKAWENNVFWNQDNYRPDLSARIVNEIYKKLDNETQQKLASSFSNTDKVDVEAGLAFGNFSASVKTSTDYSKEGSNSSESLNKFMNEAKDRVEWDGVKFVPKQMELYAINMARLKNSQEFKDMDIQISYATSMLTIDVRYDSSFDPETSSELFELETKVSGLNTSISSSFGDLRRDMANLKDEFRKEIRELEHVKRNGESSRIPPSSCQELSERGHYLEGLYAIKDNATKKVQTVYCQFKSSTASQDFIGHVDVKTKNVHFYVQRKSVFSTVKTKIPFELARLNEGNAFNLSSGIFTVPFSGIYYFAFTGFKDYYAKSLEIFLQVNDINVSYAYTLYYDAVSLSASLRLAAGDRVNLFHSAGVLYDNDNHHIHFTGWLVEEDMM